MNEDPLHPVEATLQEYVARRRRAWRGPRAIPEHVRQRLHREVERLAAAATRRSEGVTPVSGLWEWLRRPWAWGGVLGVMLTGLVLWKTFRSGPGESEMLSAQEPAAARQGQTADSQPPAVAAERLVAAPAAPIAGKDAEADRRSTFAAAAVETEAMADKLAAPVVAVTKPSAEVAEAGAVASFGVVAEAPLVQQRFTQWAAAPTNQVLQSFRVEQIGSRLQLVDADGSIYPATLASPAEVSPPATAPSPGLATRAAPATSATRAVTTPAPARQQTANTQPPHVIGLRAAGTNRGLQQEVRFVGRLLLTNVAPPPLPDQPQALLTNAAALQFLISNSRLEGQVQVGATNQSPVVALPTER
jgi:hypothetical protein